MTTGTNRRRARAAWLSLGFAAAMLLPHAAEAEQPWRPVGLLGESTTAIAVDPHDASTLYAAANGTVLKSTDAGRVWRATGYSGIATRLLVDRYVRARLYALGESESTRSLSRSPDGGATWFGANQGIVLPVFDVGLDARNPNALWAANDYVVYRSQDNATTWREFARPPHAITGFAVSHARSAVYVAMYREGVRGFFSPADSRGRGVDAPMGDCPVLGAQSITAWVAADPVRPNVQYARYGGGCKTEDGGVTWNYLPAVADRIVLIDPFFPDTLYGVQRRSRDGGSTWERFDIGLPQGTEIIALAADPGRPGRIYAATTNGVHAVEETPPLPPCPGDCNFDGSVTVDELTLGVSVALARAPYAACSGLDYDNNGRVSVGELIQGVNAALADCRD